VSLTQKTSYFVIIDIVAKYIDQFSLFYWHILRTIMAIRFNLYPTEIYQESSVSSAYFCRVVYTP